MSSFNVQASFKRSEASPLNHQDPFPDNVPGPETLQDQMQIMQGLLKDPRLPAAFIPIVKEAGKLHNLLFASCSSYLLPSVLTSLLLRVGATTHCPDCLVFALYWSICLYHHVNV